MTVAAASCSAVLRRAIRLEQLTVGWNVVVGAVAIAACLAAGSGALVGFGVDSDSASPVRHRDTPSASTRSARLKPVSADAPDATGPTQRDLLMGMRGASGGSRPPSTRPLGTRRSASSDGEHAPLRRLHPRPPRLARASAPTTSRRTREQVGQTAGLRGRTRVNRRAAAEVHHDHCVRVVLRAC